MLKQYKLRFYNFRLIIFLLAISLIGVTLVGTAASDLRSKQFAGVILGLIVMLILSLLDYSWIMNFQWIMYGFNIIMLIVVRIAGDSANGAARWIGIGSFRFQPTELSKIILIVFFAKFFMDHEETLNTLKTLALSGVLLAVPLFLILEQPDLKNTITVVVIFCIMIYIAGLSYKIIGGALLIAVPLTIIFFINCCPAGSETAQGLPEKPYHVFFCIRKTKNTRMILNSRITLKLQLLQGNWLVRN